MKKIVITGGAGFIGSHLTEHLFKTYNKTKFIIIDKITYAANKKYLKLILKSKRVKFLKCDLLSSNKYAKYIKDCDYAINVAAESHVDRSFQSSLIFTRTNTLGTHTFINSCIQMNVKKIIHVSTDEVYGQVFRGSKSEKSKLDPTNPYSASKAAAEMIINSYDKIYKNKITIIRANNIYGIRQFPEKLIPSSICRLIKKQKIQLHGKGIQQRCFLSVYDFCEAIEILINKKASGIYNIGNLESFRNIDIVLEIIKKFHGSKNLKYVKFVKDRKFNDFRYYINFNKIKKLGWKPKRNIKNDLDDIIFWYKKNIRLYNI